MNREDLGTVGNSNRDGHKSEGTKFKGAEYSKEERRAVVQKLQWGARRTLTPSSRACGICTVTITNNNKKKNNNTTLIISCFH